MPLSIHAIRSVEIGSISTRKIDAPCQLDSYQDEDLQHLKREWLDLIEKKKIYLESQVNILNQQTNKTLDDVQREEFLLGQLMHLAEERHIAVFPPSASGIPGAPAAWQPPPTIEMHRPLIFLDTNSSNDIAGLEAILDEENKTKMLQLPLIQNASDEVWN
jgi:kinesin family protein 13